MLAPLARSLHLLSEGGPGLPAQSARVPSRCARLGTRQCVPSGPSRRAPGCRAGPAGVCACESVRLPCSVEAPSSLGPRWDYRQLKYGPSWPLAPGGVIPHTDWGRASPHMRGVLLPYLSQQVISSLSILSDLIHICSLSSSQAVWFLPDFMVFKLLF